MNFVTDKNVAFNVEWIPDNIYRNSLDSLNLESAKGDLFNSLQVLTCKTQV